MLSEEIKQELIEGLLHIFGSSMQQIILYGSVARKEETPESDVDIAVVLSEPMNDTARTQFLSWSTDMDLKHEKVFSIIDIESGNLEKWGERLPYYKRVLEEGVVLWKVA